MLLDSIADIIDKATPGPWRAEEFWRTADDCDPSGRWRIFLEGHSNPRTNSRDCDWTKDDAVFIATARSALPEALTVVRHLQDDNARLQAEVDRLRGLLVRALDLADDFDNPPFGGDSTKNTARALALIAIQMEIQL